MRGVAGVRDGESSGGAVVGDGEAKKLGSDGVGFGVVKGRETRDKKVEVRAVLILYAKVYLQTKRCDIKSINQIVTFK